MNRFAIAAGALVVLLVGLALAAWLGRDLPRRQVERGLAQRLEAEVALGRFEIEGLRRFVLRELVIRRLAGQPRLERLAVETLLVEGGVRDVLAGRFETLALDGVEIRLGPPPDDPPPEPSGPPAEVTAGRVTLARGRLVVSDGARETAIDVEADLRDLGRDLRGAARARADRLDLGALAAFAGAAEIDGETGPLALDATLVPGGRIELRAETGETRARRGETETTIPPLALEGSIARDAATGRFAFEVAPSTPVAREIVARGTWDPVLGAPVVLDARIERAELAALAALVPGLPEGLAVLGRADLEATQVDGGPIGWTLTTALDRVEHADLAASSVEIRASGTIDPRRPAAGGPIRGQAKIARLEGSLAGTRIPPGLSGIGIEFDGTVALDAETTVSGVATLRAPALGTTRVDGTWTAGTLDARWTLGDASLARLLPLLREAVGLALPDGASLDGALAAEGTARGPLDRIELAGTLLLRDLSGGYDVPDLGRVALSDASIEIRARTPNASAGSVDARSVAFRGTVRAGDLDPVPFTLDAAAGWSAREGRLAVSRAALTAGDLARVEADGTYTPAARTAAATIRASRLDLARWQAFLRPWIGDPVPGFSVKGSGEAAVEGALGADGRWRATGTGKIVGSGFASEDGAKVLEGLESAWDLDFEGTTAGEAKVRGTAEVGGLQALWDAFYADYSGLPSEAEVQASIRPREEGGFAWGGRIRWDFPDGPLVEGSLSGLPEGRLGYSAHLDVRDLERTLAKYLRGPLGDTVPWFERIEGTGAIEARLSGRFGKDETTARGSLGLRGIRLAGTKEVIEVDGLDLDLPIDLAIGPPDARGVRPVTGERRTGSLRFERLDLSELTIDRTETGLVVEGDSIALEDPLAVPILGGALGFERLRFADALRPSRRLVSAMLLSGIELRRLSDAFGLPPLEGEIEGYFPKIELTGPTLKVDGGGSVELFGGRVTIGDIAGEDLLTRFPKMTLSLEFDGIDLERVTRVFDFGSMTGVLKGHARSVELFRGVPTRFDARIESVDRGRRERIDVKAINNIAILGTGGRVSAFDRGIHKFLDRYYYTELGITMQLVNDVFLMRGLARRGERELFLKGALPFRIDIVNVKPGQTTSFRTMLERMKSVDFGTARTSELLEEPRPRERAVEREGRRRPRVAADETDQEVGEVGAEPEVRVRRIDSPSLESSSSGE